MILPRPLRLDEVPGDGLGAVEDALGVDIHVEVPVRLGEIHERPHRADAGVVVPHVDRPQLGDDRVDRGIDLLPGRDIQRPCAGATAGRRDLPGHTAAASSRSTSVTATCAPSAAYASAHARPIPRPAPEIPTTLSCRRIAPSVHVSELEVPAAASRRDDGRRRTSGVEATRPAVTVGGSWGPRIWAGGYSGAGEFARGL